MTNPEEYLRASNGIGEAVRAIVVVDREVGSIEINVDSVLNWPSKFIATSGMIDTETGTFDPNTVTVFYGHLNGTYIEIDEFAPGYSDTGNTENQIVILKPTTPWADGIATSVETMGSEVEDMQAEVDTIPSQVTAEVNSHFPIQSTDIGEQQVKYNNIDPTTQSTSPNVANYDSGWQNISLTSAVSAYSGRTPKIRRIGNMVYLTGAVSPKSNSNSMGSSAGQTIANISTTFRPSYRLDTVAHGSTRAKWLLTIYPDGVIEAARHTSSGSSYNNPTVGDWLTFNASYMI